METFVALYRGSTIGEAKLVAVSADPTIVGDVARRIGAVAPAEPDPVLDRLNRGRRAALRVVAQEADRR